MVLKYEWKAHIRKGYPLIMLLGIILCVYTEHFLVYSMFHSANMDTIMFTQRFSILGFVVVAFCAMDIFSDVREIGNMHVVLLTKCGFKQVFLSRLIVLCVWLIIWFLSIVVIDFVFVWLFFQMPDFVFANILRAIVLNFLLFPCVGLGLGISLSCLQRKFLGYILLVVGIFCSIGVFQLINVSFYNSFEGGVNLDLPARFLTLIQPNVQWSVSELYLIPVESYRWFLYIGWICLFVCAFLVSRKRGKLALLCATLSVACFSQVAFPGNISNNNANKNNVAHDYSTFEKQENAEYVDSFVSGYDMELSISKQLKADVMITIKEDRDRYTFTLYNGYHVSSVTDQDENSLDYNRVGDYITVDRGERKLSAIKIKYKGYSGTFFSNSALTVLPGFFAWYPQPGVRQIFFNETIDNYNTYGYNEDVSMFEDMQFNIRCKNDGYSFYSNLAGSDDEFAGVANAVTIVGGAFKEDTQDGKRVIYPVLSKPIDSDFIQQYKQYLRNFQDYLGVDLCQEDNFEMFFYLDSSFAMADSAGDGFWGDNYAICMSGEICPEELAYNQVYQRIPANGNRRALWFSVLERMNGRETGQVLSKDGFMKIPEDTAFLDSPIENMYTTLVDRFGEQVINKAVITYLQDESEDMSCVSFLRKLYVDLEENDAD